MSDERKFGQDICCLITLVCIAFLNLSEYIYIYLLGLFSLYFIVYIPWDVEEYYIEHVKKKRDRNWIKFPNPQLGSFSHPLTIVDLKGRIILWYLPGLLSEQHQV